MTAFRPNYPFCTLQAALSACLLLSVFCAAADPPSKDDRSSEPGFDWDAYASDTDSADYETVVHGHHLRPTDETTGFAETLDLSQSAQTVETVSDVLSDSVGVQVRRLGGLGSFGCAGIRGSTPQQVPVYLDGVRLQGAGHSVIDLGRIGLDFLDSIEIFRGTAPVSYGISGIGGLISLNTRSFDEPVSEIAGSVGSWRSARLHLLHGTRVDKTTAMVLFSTEHSAGNFVYLNRNGTNIKTSDDELVERSNNAHDASSVLLELKRPVAGWTVGAMELLSGKRQGIAGIESVATEHARLSTLGHQLRLFARRRGSGGDPWRLELHAGHALTAEDFNDTKNEIGVGFQRTISQNHTMDLGSSLVVPWSLKNDTALRLVGAYDRFEQRELVAGIAPDDSNRFSIRFGAQHDFRPTDSWLISGAVRLEAHAARFGGGPGPIGIGFIEPRRTRNLYVSPSLGLRYEPLRHLYLRTNAGRYVRVPDMTELFGDQGAVVGNAGLRAETGTNLDAGVTGMWDNLGALNLLRVDAVGFCAFVDDLISYVQNSQHTIRPENVDSARILGVELFAQAKAWDIVSAQANYTYLHGVNRSDKPYHDGKRLPGRPAHEAYGRVELFQPFVDWGFGGWIDVSYAGRNYLDQANMKEDALARSLVGMGAKLTRPDLGLTFTLEVNNVFDTIVLYDKEGRPHPLRDYEAFPLPGRTVWLTIHWRR